VEPKIIILGAAALGIAALFLLKKPEDTVSVAAPGDQGGALYYPDSTGGDPDSTGGGSTTPIFNLSSPDFPAVQQPGNNNQGSQTPSGAATGSLAQGFSDWFNTTFGAGAQFTQPNAAGTAVNINPAILSTGVSPQGFLIGNAAIIQAQLTNAAIASGIGRASLTPQSGGGISLVNMGGDSSGSAASKKAASTSSSSGGSGGSGGSSILANAPAGAIGSKVGGGYIYATSTPVTSKKEEAIYQTPVPKKEETIYQTPVPKYQSLMKK